MSYRVTLIPGDGTGAEITAVMKEVLAATGVDIQWEEVEAGEQAHRKVGTPLPPEVLTSIRRNKAAIKGPITTPIGTGFRSINVALRKELDLYACVRPCKLYRGIRSIHPHVDLVIVRENTEDLYAGVEFDSESPQAQQIIQMAQGKIDPHAAISIKSISPKATERIVRFAFEYALKHKRKKVTAVTKANIMKYTDGLFLEVARRVAEAYKNRIEYEEKLVDNMCMQLIQKPQFYDVLVLPNLYGDIVSDLCAGVVGGLGVAPGANYGEGGTALFEAVHGSAPKYKGQDKVNPTALILSAKLLLEHLGEAAAAQRLEEAVAAVIQDGKHLTYDLGGRAGTREMGRAILEALGSHAKVS